MANPLSANPFTFGARRALYGASQLARIGYYTAHYMAGRHVIGPVTSPGNAPAPSRFGNYDQAALVSAFRKLFRDEWCRIEAGIYKVPHDLRRMPQLPELFSGSRQYMREAREVSARAHRRGHSEVMDEETRKKYPRYYLQNFHFQSDGWLSEESAQVYDMQVETLFTGAADAMRRQALPSIRDELVRLRAAGQPDSETVFLDLACGTGRLLSHVKDNFTEMPAVAIDLSPDYLAQARKTCRDWSGITYMEGQAESIPLADNSVDILTTVYLFHELPPKIRRLVAAEIARVLKPGGLYLHLDTIQYGDFEGVDVLLENFPRAFHEPYYDSYCSEDLDALFGSASLRADGKSQGFLTKSSGYRKGNS
ncbi:class I SAM-dependent methyltransferase [Parvularcula sp. IMCC14364]|uniref:class I SAM-dependent methyltransferase n=1 Tax=Parvularcula sp. IMCC14364 TaxID=3067902 RepID=UPI0027408A3B|nr:class I SAM-dependent methyltransferase [Parvularcula sp. IMCC14364]